MTNIQKAILQFYNRFAPAFLEALVPDDAVFPRITYSFSTSDVFVNTLSTFQIWDRARHTANIEEIAGKIEEAIPAIVGTDIEIMGGCVYEWRNPATGVWEEFELGEFGEVESESYSLEPGGEFQWRQSDGEAKGCLRLFRGSPFIQPRPPLSERDIIVYSGNIEVRRLTL